MDLPNLAEKLRTTATASEHELVKELAKLARSMNGAPPKPKDIDDLLIAFFDHLLSEGQYAAVLNMLRLWQVADIYCKDSIDSLALEFHGSSEEYRRNCVQVLFDFECLGVRFHKIRFLQDPRKDGLAVAEAGGVPPIQHNTKLIEPIRRKLDMNFGDTYWKTVADVRDWGFECDLDPALSLKTELWVWRSLSMGS
jgi:hypothetical protein